MNPHTHQLVELGQKALIFHQGACLILEFRHTPGKWDIPGGRLAEGEKLDDAFARELIEEIGLKLWHKIGIVDYAVISVSHIPNHAPICLIANVIDAQVGDIVLSDEHISYRWVSREELDTVTFLHPEVGQFVEKGFDFIERHHGQE